MESLLYVQCCECCQAATTQTMHDRWFITDAMTVQRMENKDLVSASAFYPGQLFIVYIAVTIYYEHATVVSVINWKL